MCTREHELPRKMCPFSNIGVRWGRAGRGSKRGDDHNDRKDMASGIGGQPGQCDGSKPRLETSRTVEGSIMLDTLICE